MESEAQEPSTAAAEPPPLAAAGDDTPDLDELPKVAVIGASSDRRKYGNKCVRAYLQAGWEVYPVNPSEDRVEGAVVRRSVLDVPGRLDRIALYLPPPITLRVLPEVAEKGARDGVFFNPGTWDAEVIRRAEELEIPVRRECAILAIGFSPAQFPA